METIYELDDSHLKYHQPVGIDIPLKPHQKTSLYRMIITEQCNDSNVGILADSPGYGKTITFLSLVQEQKDQTFIWKPFSKLYSSNGDSCILYDTKKFTFFRLTVLVIPEYLLLHWESHIQLYTHLVYDSISCKHDISKILLSDIDILIIPSSLFIDFLLFSRNMNYAYNRIAFDEADILPIPKSKYMFHSRFMWLITTTYKSLLYKNNNINKFLSHVFRSQQTSFFNPVVIHCNIDYIKQSFHIPPPEIHIIRCLTPVSLSLLRSHVSSKILNFLNAGNIEDAILELGGNIYSQRNLFLLMEKKYTHQINQLTCLLSQVSNPDEHKKNTDKLSRINSQYARFKEQLSSISSFRCPICYDSLKSPTLLLCCNNIFCAECILRWGRDCPMCRQSHSEMYTISSDSQSLSFQKKPRKLTKYENVIKIIQKNPSGKFLIFAESISSFHSLLDYILDISVSAKLLDSSSLPTFFDTIHDFKTNTLQVLCIASKLHGSGIELPETTDVILLHHMNPDLELQSIARAQRPGRTSVLHIWKLYFSYE